MSIFFTTDWRFLDPTVVMFKAALSADLASQRLRVMASSHEAKVKAGENHRRLLLIGGFFVKKNYIWWTTFLSLGPLKLGFSKIIPKNDMKIQHGDPSDS